MKNRGYKVAAIVSAWAILMVACTPWQGTGVRTHPSNPSHGPHGGNTGSPQPGSSKNPDPSGSGSLGSADPSPSVETVTDASTSWPVFGNNAWQDRYSLDNQLTPTTVQALHLVATTTIPNTHGGNESFPLEEQGILYVTSSEGEVVAIDAGTGQVRWSYTPQTQVHHEIPQINRGVAISDDAVYELTPDDQLIALRKSDGTQLFDTTVASQDEGYFESMAPIVADHRVIVGSSGGDEGVRGFLAAFDAGDGHRLWNFYTVPRRGEGWVPASGDHGGGAVWTTPAYDPAEQRIYFGTGNPSPDYYGQERPGPDPYTDAVIRLDARQGTMDWYQQEVPHDLWDYDVASPPLLFRVQHRLVVGEAGKDGYWYEWDAKTGQQIIDPVPFVKQDHSPPTESGTEEWPGPAGGATYGPSAYDPKTREVYVAGINGPEVLYAKPQSHQGHQVDFGTGQQPAPATEWTGTITAISVDTGKIAWQRSTPTPPIGGVSVNAGGIVCFGQANGTLEALSAQTGETVWSTDTGAPLGSAPIFYELQGRPYVTVVTGGAKSLLSLFPYTGVDRVLTYSISADGKSSH